MKDTACPNCGSNRTWAHGRHRGRKKSPRRYCPACNKTFTIGPVVGHRPPIGDRPLTRAEILRRYRERLRKAAQRIYQA